MIEKIIEDILNLKNGETFTIGEYLNKYNITDKKLRFKLCFNIVKKLENKIEPALKSNEEKPAFIGIPENFPYKIK